MEGNHIITDTGQNGVSISYLTCMLLPPIGYVLVCIRLPVCLSDNTKRNKQTFF